MTRDGKLIGKHYEDLYADYYSDANEIFLKRKISASQTVDCMIDALGPRAFHRLLDVGAGNGNVLSRLEGKGVADELYAVEISESGIEAIKTRQLPSLCAVRLFDGYKIPYPDKYFDLAIAIHVLEHVEHERMFLQEICRVSRHAYIEVPLEHGFRIQRSIDYGKKYGHINFYTKETLQSMLESSGLKVLNCNVVASLLEYERHISGYFRGAMKNFIRRFALAVAPNLAPWFFVYNGHAYCKCS